MTSIGIISSGKEENKVSIRPYIKHVGNIGLVLVFTSILSPVAFADEGKNAAQAALQAEQVKKRLTRMKAVASSASLVCVKASEKRETSGTSVTTSLLLVLCGALLGWMIKPIGEF
jgi:hypothetical protein